VKAYLDLLKPAQFALILFMLFAIGSLIGVVGIERYRSGVALEIVNTEKLLANTREDVRKLNFDLEAISQLGEKFRKFNQLGFLGTPDRDAWVQRLEAIYRDTHLPATLRYTLSPAQPLNSQAIADGSPLDHQKNVMYHDLVLDISGVHEIEFLDFITRLNKDWHTPYRVENCQMVREGEIDVLAGLEIKCTLKLFSLPVAEKK
jgi:hypothetical protein